MKKLLLKLFISLFVLIMLAPLFFMALGYKPRNKENRPLTQFSAVKRAGLAEFPNKFDEYFEDNFGLREEMVSGFNYLTIKLINDCLNKSVIIGKDMFFYSETLPDYLGTNLLSEFEIKCIANNIRLIDEYAKEKGAQFVFSIAPNKNTIYPELMPSYYKKSQAKSNRERLYEELSRLGVKSISYADLLLSSKDSLPLYHQRDTHWNDTGAIIAYNAIIDAIGADAERMDYSSPEYAPDYAGDLHNFAYPAFNGLNMRPEYSFVPDFAYDEGARPLQDATFATYSGKSEFKLYLMRDSFAIALIPYLSTNLGRVLYSSEFPFNLTLAEPEPYDTYLIELVERNIPNLLTAAPMMSAVKKELPATATQADTQIQLSERGDYTHVHGYIEYDRAAAPPHLFLSLDLDAYEAFVTFERDGFLGFSLHLPSGLDFSGAMLWVDR